VTSENTIRVALYTRQPFVAQGMAAVFQNLKDLEFAACCDSLAAVLDGLQCLQPHILVVHAGAGLNLAEIRELRSAGPACRVILWGENLSGDFAFQAIQSGVRGILPDTTPVSVFLDALHKIHRGALCFENSLLESVLSQQRVTLTARQGQIVSLVAQGLKNKEIAFSMGITEGTVKVYLYKLFKKLGMRDQLELALYGRRNLFSGPSGFESVRDVAQREPPSLMLVTRKQLGDTVIH
jgi:two-component system, NarL family, nitrate/nitrite response regulator NarL